MIIENNILVLENFDLQWYLSTDVQAITSH